MGLLIQHTPKTESDGIIETTQLKVKLNIQMFLILQSLHNL